MSDGEGDVLYAVDDGVALLTFNRPGRRNAWNLPMERRYHELLDIAASSTDVRVIVVTGAGDDFCVGADMDRLAVIAEERGLQGERRPAAFPRSIQKPIIAAVNGACAGVGFVNMLMTDIRFAAREARITTAFSRRGLVPEHGSGWVLSRLIGEGRAMELLLTGRTIDADEAFRLGLVHEVIDRAELLDRVLAYAGELATRCSPQSMAYTKALVHSAAATDLTIAIQSAHAAVTAVMQTDEVKEGVRAWRERRPPHFRPVIQTADPRATETSGTVRLAGEPATTGGSAC